jgi:hypothetical protein
VETNHRILDSDIVLSGQGDDDLVVPLHQTKRGSFWWVLEDDNGEIAYRGLEIPAQGRPLPSSIFINGVEMVLGPVPKWDKKRKTSLEIVEPFEKTRRFHGQVILMDVLLEVRLRLTVKKNTNWNFSVRIWPEEPLFREGPDAFPVTSDPILELYKETEEDSLRG